MALVEVNIKIDSKIKNAAEEIFGELGLDINSAINIFLHQCLICGGLPFKVELSHYKQSVIDSFEEGQKISKDPNVKGYESMEELKEALDS